MSRRNEPWAKSRPLFSWQGNKGRASREIVQYFPNHRVYVEPRVGGGSVFFAKSPSRREILSDPHSDVITLFESARNRVRCRGVVQSQDDLRRLVRQRSKNVCETYARVKCSRDHRGELPRGIEGYPCPVKWPPETHVNRLRNVALERGEYESVMRRFDGPDT